MNLLRMHTRRRDEAGIAMIMTVIVILVAGALAAVILTQGTNTERHSGRGAHWNEALQTADAGIQNAIAEMQATGAAPAPFTGTTSEGSYSVTVTPLGRSRYRFDSTGTSGSAQGLRSERHVRVVMAPPKSFKYALFSLTDISTKNNNHVIGDIWANGSVTVELGDKVDGDVTAANGFLTMENNSEINGDVQTGNVNASKVAMQVNEINGSATASSTHPDCGDDPGYSSYKITGGTISGIAKSWGSISSSAPTKVTHVCTNAPAQKPIPGFNFAAANYSPPPHIFATTAQFAAYVAGHKNDMNGTFYITGGGQNDPVDISGISVSGDLAIIATQAPITADSGSADVTSANSNDKILVLASFYAPPANVACATNGGNPGDCAIGIKNNFGPADNTATLVYAPNGPVAFKNKGGSTPEFLGAIYASNIVLKNNQVIEYDSRVEQVVGFGPVTLERESWIEVAG